MKRGVLFLLPIILINFISAGFFTETMESQEIFIGAIFMVIFGLSYFSLSKFIKNNALAVIISLCFALIVLYGLGQSGFDPDSIAVDLGFGDDSVSMFLPWILIAILIILAFKLKLKTFLVVGAFLLAMGIIGEQFFDMTTNADTLMGLGIFLIIVWIIAEFLAKMWSKKKGIATVAGSVAGAGWRGGKWFGNKIKTYPQRLRESLEGTNKRRKEERKQAEKHYKDCYNNVNQAIKEINYWTDFINSGKCKSEEDRKDSLYHLSKARERHNQALSELKRAEQYMKRFN